LLPSVCITPRIALESTAPHSIKRLAGVKNPSCIKTHSQIIARAT
jgi:hypothetical protein